MKRTNKKGFTIVELVIVIAVIAILAAVLIPNISRLVKKANESSDIQAVRNMNTFLAAEGATGDIKSILDVYDLFVDSGYNVKSYSPLYSGRHFYYDKQYNQILYVETKTNKVLFPEERKNEDIVTLRDTKSHDLFSLSMEVPGEKAPSDYTNPDNNGKITATIKDAKEYAFIIKEYNKTASAKELNLTIDGTIDMMGAQCLIENTKGAITISGKNNAVLKNLTSNTFGFTSNGNAQGIDSKYASGAIVGNAKHDVVIKDLTFENINVKNIESGSVALLVGQTSGSVTIESVTIKNSSVVGQRSVGALIGQVSGTVTLKNNIYLQNVSVRTIGGRSALLIGQLNDVKAIDTKLVVKEAQITLDKSTLGIYENAASEQKYASGAPTECPTGWNSEVWNKKSSIKNQDQYIWSVKDFNSDGTKTYTVYGYKADALVLTNDSQTAVEWTSYASTDAHLNGHVTIK